jgi:hypothetical protein
MLLASNLSRETPREEMVLVRMALSYLHIDRNNDNILHKSQAFASTSE